MSQDTLKAPRYEIRPCWNDGKKRFVVRDLQPGRGVLATFDSALYASIHTTLLWLEHLRQARSVKPRPVLTSVDAGGRREAG
jgi:hypothetical protein